MGILAQFAMYAQTPEFGEMDEERYIEILDYEKYARPKVLGRDGDAVLVIERDIERNRLITSTLVRIENNEVAKSIEVSPLEGETESVIKAQYYDGMIFCYGYRWRGRGKKYADQFIRIFDSSLKRVGQDIIIASMILDRSELGLGMQSGFLGTIGAIPVVCPIFTSSISKDENGNYAFWTTKLSTGPSAEQVEKMIKRGVIEGDKDDAIEISLAKMDMQIHFVNIDPNGKIQRNDSIYIGVEDEERKTLSGALVNGCTFFGKGDDQIMLVDIWQPRSATGMNVFDDARFPWITKHFPIISKIKDGRMVKIYAPDNTLNYLTCNGYRDKGKFFVKGFYALEGQTGWAGVYNLEFDEDLNLLHKEFLPLEENIDHESLNGDKAFTLHGMYRDSQGQIQNAQIIEFEDGRKVLIGELYSQITREKDRIDTRNKNKPLGSRKYGNRVNTRVSVEDIASVSHYYNKLVIFEIDEFNSYTKEVAVILKKQKTGTHKTNYMSYAASADSTDLIIHFNDTKEVLSNGYIWSKSMYGGETGKKHVLQEYRVDQDMNLKQTLYLKGTQRNLLPRARYIDEDGVIDLFSDKKDLLLYEW